MLSYKKFELHPDAAWITFIHGAGGSSTIWFKQLKAFKQQFNVLLIDLRGHGNSQSLKIAQMYHYTFEDISDDILVVLDHLCIEKTHFVGISLGTIIIRELSERFPERTLSLTMGGAIMQMNLRCRFLLNLANLVKSWMPYMYLYKFFAFIIMPKKNHNESRILFVNEAKKLCQNEFKKWVKLFTTLRPILNFFQQKDLGIPTFYVMGEEDYMFLPAVQEISRTHACADLYVIPNCGHVVNIEQPNIFNEKVLKFIQNLQLNGNVSLS